MRVLVTGASGLVGGALATALTRAFDVVGTRRAHAAPPALRAIDLDLCDPRAVAEGLDAARPDAIVHCAALADADRCEAEPALAAALNVDATHTLAVEAMRRSCRFVFISTDLVFDGSAGQRRESDAVRPLMLYGRTKAAAEAIVAKVDRRAAVLRIALACGRGHGRRATATESIAWRLHAGGRLRLFTDQQRTPLDPASVADAVARVLRRGASGVFHLGGPERLSRHELGLRTARVLGLDARLIEAVDSNAVPLAAQRPSDASLDSSRARAELGWLPASLDDMIRSGRPTPL